MKSNSPRSSNSMKKEFKQKKETPSKKEFFNKRDNPNKKEFTSKRDLFSRKESAPKREYSDRTEFESPKEKTSDLTQKIFGKNPVLEALKANKTIEKIYLLVSVKKESMGNIFSLAKAAKIPVVLSTPEKFYKMIPEGSAHQGVVALLSPVSYITLDDWISQYKDHPHAGIAILDEIEDTQNLGAIIRSAEVLGLQGLLFPIHHSAPLNEAAVKTSAGAIYHLPLIKTTNLNQSIDQLKSAGFWIYGLEADGEELTEKTKLNFPIGIVVGSEGKGLRPLVRKHCDGVVRLSQTGKINSLNASVAAGVMFYEVLKRKLKS